MKKQKKLTVWISGILAVLMLLTGALILLGPRLVDSDVAKREIVDHLSRRVGGQVHFAHADFLFFPQPHVVIRGAGLSIPGRVSADIPSVTIYLKVWPLLIGRMDIARLSAQSPCFTINLPHSEPGGKATSRRWTMEGLSTEAAGLLGPALSGMEDLSLQVRDGKITFIRGNKTVLGVDRIELQSESSSKQLAIELSGESGPCKNISLKVRVDPSAHKADGRIDLKGLKPRRLPASLIPEGPIQIGADETGLNLAFKADLNQGLKLDIQGSASPFTLMRGDKTAVFKGARFNGTVHSESGCVTISFSKLHLDHPRLNLSGEMSVNGRTPRVRLRLEAREVDVSSIREAALTLGGTIPDVQRIFEIVRGGQVPLIAISSQADSAADLGDLDHLHISGRISKGHIFVPETGMDLEDVNGDASISKGILTGTRLQARLGKACGSNGTLKLGLAGHNPPFRLDIMIQADLTEALPVVQGLITNPSLKREMGQIDQIQGSATARLILGETTETITARVDASEFDLMARYHPIPYLLQARGGRLSYDNSRVKANQIAVRIGRSSIAGLSGMLDWHGEPFLEMEAGTTSILLDEIHPWLVCLNRTEKTLKDLSSLKGALLLKALTINGPLLNPMAWRFNTEGGIRDLALVSKRLPGPLILTKGTAKADADTITFEGTGMGILDARLNLSGRAAGYIKGISSLETVIDGHLGQEAVRFISDAISLPLDIRPRSPMTVSKAHIAWTRGAETSFKGDLMVADGPRISLNAFRTPRLLKVEDLRIIDDTSDAIFRFSLGQEAVGIGFTGNLKQTCLDSLLLKNRFLTGSIKGDLWGRIIPGSPIESTIEGHLEGGDIALQQLDLPAVINTFSLKAGQQRLHLTSDIIALDDRQIHVDADFDMSEQGILFRLDAAAGGIDLERTMAALKKVDQKFAGGKDPTQWSVPVRGTAHIKLDRLTYGKFEWKPFNCDISSEGNAIHIAVREASLCGVSAPGTVEIFPGKMALHVLPDAKGGELASTIDCLTRESIKISGTFDFKGDITGEGTGESLIRSLNGPIQFVSKNGRIDRFGLLMNIFSLLNITEIFRGRLPDLRSQGFAYHSITVDGHLKDGKLHLEKALLDGSSMNIAGTGHIDLLNEKLDLTVFAAPFKTADRILRMLPVIGYILDGTLVSIAVKVTGDVKNPEIDYLPASMVESGLLGIMKRTLKAPVKVLTPIMPE